MKELLTVGAIVVTSALSGDVYPTAEIRYSPVNAAMAGAPSLGDSPAGDAGTLPLLPAELLAAMAKPNPVDVIRYARDGRIIEMLDVLVDGQEASLPRLQLVEAVLAMPALRDIAIPTWSHGRTHGEMSLDAQAEFHATGTMDAYPEVDGILYGDAARPEAARIEAIIHVLARTAAVLPAARSVPTLTVLGWMEWALGRSSRSAVWIQNARAIDPDYPLAQLIAKMLDQGHLASWSFAVPEDEDDLTYLN